MKVKPLPTREQLDELLHFNPDTGEIRWKVSKGTAKAGNIAGSIFINPATGKQYRQIRIDGIHYKAHRLAHYYYTGEQPPEVDHKNGNSLDNRKYNLRPSNRNHNANNCKMPKNNKTGVIGVSYDKTTKLFCAQYGSMKFIKKHGTRKYFNDFFEAVCCRKSWECQFGMAELKKHRKD